MGQKPLPSEALLDLRRRLSAFAPRSRERRLIMQQTAHLYGVSEDTLYRAETETEANAWLLNFLICYNSLPHRCEPHSRFNDWLENLPSAGLRKMCRWERFCTFAREPEQRLVGVDGRISTDGVSYQLDPELAGETVVLWWGVFDSELYVEHGEQRYGPFLPVDGPIPLNRYRRFKRTKTQQRAERVEALASELKLPKAALEEAPDLRESLAATQLPTQAFRDPDPFQEFTFPSVIAAKGAITDYLGLPLGKLPQAQLDDINALLAETLDKREVMARIRDNFQITRGRPPC